jgi:hypothetical protein
VRFRRKRDEDEDVALTAAEALEQSQTALAEANERWPAVKQVAASLRGSRQENHFSDRIAQTFREKTG